MQIQKHDPERTALKHFFISLSSVYHREVSFVGGVKVLEDLEILLVDRLVGLVG